MINNFTYKISKRWSVRSFSITNGFPIVLLDVPGDDHHFHFGFIKDGEFHMEKKFVSLTSSVSYFAEAAITRT